MTGKDKKNIYASITLLVVENNPNTMLLYKECLKDTFKSIVFAQTEKEVLRLFERQHFGLFICQHKLPMMNGMDLIRALREKNKVVPIILAADAQEYETFQQAVDLNVTHSLMKPFNCESILHALDETYEPALSYFLYQKSLKDELSSLKDQKKYDNTQHKQAFLKEHQAIRNDFYYKYYKHPEQTNLWYLDGSYRPHEILSGDTYSIRRINKDRAFFFIIDAMGKGVSASVTSVVASSYINHLVDLSKEAFDLNRLLSDFSTYILKSLLDEEVLAVLFAEINFSLETLSISSYGMPPVLLCDKETNITKIKTNNMPISKHYVQFNIDIHQIQNIDKILFCSDGLVESSLENGELYFSHLKKDFKDSKNRSSFLKKLYNKVPNPDDDITLLFFQRFEQSQEGVIDIECKSTLKEIENVIEGFHTYLEQNSIGPIHTAKLGMIFTEMIMNAYEHGSLDISNTLKKELISQGVFDDECRNREHRYQNRHIQIRYQLIPHGKGKDLTFDIKDEGDGFDTQLFKKLIFDTTSVNGRGFKIAKKMVDAIYYSPKGNHVILHKYIPKEL